MLLIFGKQFSDIVLTPGISHGFKLQTLNIKLYSTPRMKDGRQGAHGTEQ